MTNTNTNAVRLIIILSTSVYTGQPVIGMAFAGERTPCNLTKWADELPHGRPATVQPFNGRSQADTINFLTARWAEWSERAGIPLEINTKPRKVAGPF